MAILEQNARLVAMPLLHDQGAAQVVFEAVQKNVGDRGLYELSLCAPCG